MTAAHSIHQLTELHGKTCVFRDRADAGTRLADMLHEHQDSNMLLLAIPAGGVPVAAEIAARWRQPLDVAVVSKILLPWTTEAGFGAVAFDGSLWVNEDHVLHYGLTRAQIEQCTQKTREKVARRVELFRGRRAFPRLTGRTVVIVDDGMAAGSTMRVAVQALHHGGAKLVIVAVPTGHDRSVHEIAAFATQVYCANVRAGLSFAVADAYQHWTDTAEEEVLAILDRFRPESDPG